MGGNATKHIGVQVSEHFFKIVKIALAERGQSVRDAVITALGKHLNIPERDIEDEFKEVNEREQQTLPT